ncbi:MAG TPA: hypothetical protein VG826_05280 [Pirellulales bacterium]|nr:hypothetical protein [Pirellulales bacterium]
MTERIIRYLMNEHTRDRRQAERLAEEVFALANRRQPLSSPVAWCLMVACRLQGSGEVRLQA